MDDQPLEFAPNPEAEQGVTAQQFELEQLREYKDKYLRLLAESENTRKRMQRERQESVRHAIGDVIVEFLHPLDHLENALKFADQATPDVQNWAVGFKMIVAQFKDALANHGVFAFESAGRPFDPHLHEAVEMIETDDQPPGIVSEEMIRGYKIGERVLRPARVKVTKAKEKTEFKQVQENENHD